ncbi:hypothetical protein CRG98_048218 [Punica granatum]|uniref:RNase H type-1 domain-containing protein n=1 Tax=Punica granatum TaxID=22663 RepID=A0A2I0HI65_PUNGR|nr:hypothetical protein CRG98_048218 [Punica granatum]
MERKQRFPIWVVGSDKFAPFLWGNPDDAGAGGLIRDDNGQWILGFATNIGYTTAAVAELWGVLTGLEQAWHLEYCRVDLEMDSKVVRDIIVSADPATLHLAMLIDHIRDLLNRDWSVQVHHIYREGNGRAYWMARATLTLSVGLHVFHNPPTFLGLLLFGDIVGPIMPLLVTC